MGFITTFLTTAKAEMKRLVNNKRNLVVLVGSPILFLTLFGLVYSNHVVTGINTVILDQDNSSLSRTVINSFANSEKFHIVRSVESEPELQKAMQSGEAEAAIVVPSHFMKDIKKQHPTQVLLIASGANMIYANSIMSASVEIVTTLSAGTTIKLLEARGIMPPSATGLVQPISFRNRVWYNPTFNYGNFLLLGLLGTAVQQVMLLFTSIAMVELKPEEDFAKTPVSLGNVAAFTLGKATPYFLVCLINCTGVLWELTNIFKVPMLGSWLNVLLLEAIFLASVSILGIFLSLICTDSLQATQMAMLVAVPSFIFSGYTWPLDSMPLSMQAIGRILPLTYFVNPLRKLAMMGVGLELISTDLLVLAGGFCTFFPISVLLIRWKLRHHSPSAELPIQLQEQA